MRSRGTCGARFRWVWMLTVVALSMSSAVVSTADSGPDSNAGKPIIGPWRGTYLPHGWIASPRAEELVTERVLELRRLAITEQIHNIGAMDATGSVPASDYGGLAQWIKVSRQVAPEQEIILWVSGDTDIHVNDSSLHEAVAGWLSKLVISHEVDGVLLDLEPFRPDHAELIPLLQTIKQSLPNTWIGITAPPDNRWSGSYIAKLSMVVDGVSPLLYDTALTEAAQYRTRVVEQVARYQAAGIGASITPSLPSHSANPWHDPSVENVAEAAAALSELEQRVPGAAVYWWLEFAEESRQSWLDAVGVTALPPPPGGFSDVADENPHSADIAEMADSGITRGCNPPLNDRYCPRRPVTRGELAAFLHRALHHLPAKVSPAPVDTVGSLFVEDVLWMVGTGISRGCNPPNNDRFCPDAVVTRGEMAAFLARALDLPTSEGTFGDTSGSVFAHDIARLAAHKITSGCNPPENTEFCPDDPVNRQQLATFLARSLTWLEQG